jgi:hypothetical protein
MMIPSSITRLVEANSNPIAAVKSAPLRRASGRARPRRRSRRRRRRRARRRCRASAASRPAERLPRDVSEVRRGQVDAGVLGRDPDAAAIEDAHVGGVHVGDAGVDGGEDAVGLPHRSKPGHGADQVVERERLPPGEEAANARRPVRTRLDGDEQQHDLAPLRRRKEAIGRGDHAGDDRTLLGALRVDERQQHNLASLGTHRDERAPVVRSAKSGARIRGGGSLGTDRDERAPVVRSAKSGARIRRGGSLPRRRRSRAPRRDRPTISIWSITTPDARRASDP